MTSPSQSLGYSNNQLNCKQIKIRFQAFGNHGFQKSLKVEETLFSALPKDRRVDLYKTLGSPSQGSARILLKETCSFMT